MTRWVARQTATLGGVGYLSPGPGSWGALVALPLAWALHVLGGFPLLAGMTLIAFAAGWWATIEMTLAAPEEDPSEIVIDELAGQWVALWPVSAGAAFAGVDVLLLWPGWVLAFFAFRVFDISKIGPVGWADRHHGPFGVMFDDVIAGALAAVVVGLGAAIAHLFVTA